MPYKPGDPYSKEFVTSTPTTGAAVNADSMPVATAGLYGSGTGAMVLTVTNLAVGLYKIAGTIPSTRVNGDVLSVSVAATCGGVAGKAVVDTQVLDDKAGYALSVAGLDVVKGWGTWSQRQTLQAIAQFLFGKRSGVPASGAGGSPAYVDNAAVSYGSVTVDTAGNITASGLTPPA
jgi:hypothetical protein